MSLDTLQAVLTIVAGGFTFFAGLALVEVRRYTLAYRAAQAVADELAAAYIARWGQAPQL